VVVGTLPFSQCGTGGHTIPRVYGPARLPGYTQHANLKVDVLVTAVCWSEVRGERALGSVW